MKKMYTRVAALLPVIFLFVAALPAQTYQPVVTSAVGCSTDGTYNYTSLTNGKPSYTLSYSSDVQIFWENSKWNLAAPNWSEYYFENTADTPLPPCEGWVEGSYNGGCGVLTLSGGCSSAPCPSTTYDLTVTITTSGNTAIASSFTYGGGDVNGKPFWTGTTFETQNLQWSTDNNRWEIVNTAGTVRMFNTNVADLNVPCTGWQSESFGPPVTLLTNGMACGNIIASPVPTVTITADPGNTITSGTSVTFTATPTNGGSTPAYQWKVNGMNVGMNQATYTSTTLANSDVVTCEMTSNDPCADPAMAVSAGITMTVTAAAPIAACLWTSQTSAANNQWQSVTYGNGLFVAVALDGTGNRVMTSPDGINWTSRTPAADNQWRSVTYGNGLFVAVASSGTGNRVMTSPDGITWTSRSSAADNSWNGVTYGNGLFVAVASIGTGNRVMTSPDGITWTIRTSAADNQWQSVTYGNGLFVAVALTGTGNRVMTSPDGINWTIRTSAADNQWRSVTYSNGLFVAVAALGTGNRVMTSPDGITWAIRSSAADNIWSSVTYGNGFFVAVAASGTGNRVMTGSGSLVPASVSIAADPGNSITAGTSVTFTATPTNGGSTPAYQWKVNGTNVGMNQATYTSTTLEDDDVVTCEMTSNDPCADPTTATSNEITMEVSSPCTFTPTDVVVSGLDNGYEMYNGTYTPNGSMNGAPVWSFGDASIGFSGTYWTIETVAFPIAINFDGAVDELPCTGWLAEDSAFPDLSGGCGSLSGTLTPTVAIAADPSGSIAPGTSVTFTATPTNGGSTPAYQWKVNGMNVGLDQATYTSTALANGDVVTCEMTSSAPCADPATAVSNAVVMTVTAPCPPAGETWTAQNAAEANQWTSVTYGNGLFVAVAENGTNRAMTSSDGITWTARSAAQANEWQSVTYGNDLFVAVAFSGTNRVMTSPDGITWTAQTEPVSSFWRSVTYGNGLFVAVAQIGTNRVMTSSDGITWTARSAAEANLWQSVTYGNGLFVAVANSGTHRVMTSPDGITWTARTAAGANDWISVTYGNGLFVAVANSGTHRVMTSPDGITWTARTAAVADDWRFVTYGNDLFVAVATSGANRVMTSPDGITWTAQTAAEANIWRSVIFGNGSFVAVAYSGTNRVMTSSGSVTPTVTITADPGNTITSGTSVTFTATPTNGGSTPAYQWKVNGTNVGMNQATYTSTTLANNDVVTCEMTSNDPCADPALAVSNEIVMEVETVLTPECTKIHITTNCSDYDGDYLFTDYYQGAGYWTHVTEGYEIYFNGDEWVLDSEFFNNSTDSPFPPTTGWLPTPGEDCDGQPITSFEIIQLNVLPEVTISVDPSNAIEQGTNATFTATPLYGGDTPVYQWKLNGNPVGTDSDTYANATLADGDVVTCEMTSDDPCADPALAVSNEITMEVVICSEYLTASVAIAADPSGSLAAGTNVTFTATPTNGGTAPSYQWKVNGNDVGSNSTTYTTDALENGDVVTCVMINNNPCASPAFPESNTITMEVGAFPPPSFTGLDENYCDLDAPVTLTGNLPAALGRFDGPGITDNGDGTATFTPGDALGTGTIRYLSTASGSTGWASVTGGLKHSVGLKTDGTLWAWGNNDFSGQLGNGSTTNEDIPVQIGIANDWAAIAVGYYHSVAIKTDGTLWAWGYNNFGQLGNGSNTDSNVPVQIGTDNNWVSISSKNYFTLALKSDGSIWAWGYNNAGQLGNNTTTNSNTPVQVGTDTDWTSVSAGGSHSLALKTNGTIWAWGNNLDGQLGIGNNVGQLVPIQVGTDNDWAQVIGGNFQSYAIKTNGTIWSWGSNSIGQLGNGNYVSTNTPGQVGTDNDWVTMVSKFACHALKSDGSLWAWGRNGDGELGNGNFTDTNAPEQIGTQTNWASIGTGTWHTLAIKNNGSLFTTGWNEDGQLGDATSITKNTFNKVVSAIFTATATVDICVDFVGLDPTYCADDSPVTLTGNRAPEGTFTGPGITDNGDGTATFTPANAGAGGTVTYALVSSVWANMSAGTFHSLGVKSDGTLWGWGYNNDGELGNGTYDDTAVPVQSGTSMDWANVSAGYYHSLGVKTDGTLWGWGYNDSGELGSAGSYNPDPVQLFPGTDWVQVEAGFYVSFALKSDGTLWAWGYNNYGLLGNGTYNDSSTPVQVGTATNWASISTNPYGEYAMATRTDGTLWAWGYNNNYGQFGTGNTNNSLVPIQSGTATDWAKVDAGAYHAVGIKTSGTAWGWGLNDSGQIGNGTTTDSSVPVQVGTGADWADITTGYYCTNAVKTDGTLWGWGYNGNGQLGNGTTTDTSIPIQSGTDMDWAKVTGSDDDGYFSLGLKTNGNLYGWGYNEYGQIGDGTTDQTEVPLPSGPLVSSVTESKTVTVTPGVSGISLANISAANCNNTTCTTDDTYTADVTVTYDSKPAGGTLSLTGPNITVPVTAVDVSGIGATSYTFTGVTMLADGGDIDLTAAFSEGCSFNNGAVGTAPECEQPPYVPTPIELTSLAHPEWNGTYNPDGTENGAQRWRRGSYKIFYNLIFSVWQVRLDGSNSGFPISVAGESSPTLLPCNPTGFGVNPVNMTGGCGNLSGGNGSLFCAITDISLANTGICDDNGTTDDTDDFFTTDVTVTFAYAPASGTLTLKRGSTVVATTSTDLTCTTTHTFTGVQLPSDGNDVILTAEFSGDCTYTSGTLMTAPEPCSCVPPTFTACPSNQTAFTSANACTAVVDYTAIADGSPVGAITYVYTGVTNGSGNGTGSGATFNKGVTNVTLTATNACGAPICQFTVTVTDNVAPSITCPNAVTVTCLGNVPAPNPALVTASDNCGAPTKEHVFSLPYDVDCTNRFKVLRVYRATDGAGNSATCSQIITVFDNTLPNFTFVPANLTVQCNSIPAVGNPTATDNCGGAVTISYNSQTVSNVLCTDKYTLTRVWTATDACGNTRTASQKITVTDTQKPAFVNTPANITVQCDVIPPATAPVATDNCAAAVAVSYIGETRTNGNCPNRYTLTRRWVASDNCNNTRSISQRITVVDNNKPVLTVPANATIACSDPVPPVGTATATDGCGGNVTVAYLGQTTANNQCPGSYQIRRTWRATDACGNTTAATQTIQVSDNGAPVFVTVPDPITIECNQPLPPLVNPTASDACGGYVHITFLGNVASGSGCAQDYTVTRTWRTQDLCGNTATATQVITVVSVPAGFNPQPPVVAGFNPQHATEEVLRVETRSNTDALRVETRSYQARQVETRNCTVSPNPTTDRFRLDLTDFAGEAVTVSIFSDMGQLVWESRIPAVEDLQLPISLREAGAAAGIYTVRVRSSSGVVAKRVVLVD